MACEAELQALQTAQNNLSMWATLLVQASAALQSANQNYQSCLTGYNNANMTHTAALAAYDRCIQG